MAPPWPRKVLVFAPSEFGGIAESTHRQMLELTRRGVAVTVLTRAKPMRSPPPNGYRQCRVLPGGRGASKPGRINQVFMESADYWVLAWRVLRERPDVVLLEANTEYFAPLWAWPHLVLSRLMRVPYLANFHDPVRQRHFGPQWLHDWSVSLSHAVLWGGLIHGPVPTEAGIPARLQMALAPLGPFGEPLARAVPFDLREQLGIAAGDFVLLSFGHLADRKNIDLLIRAVSEVEGVTLVIAGDAISGSQRPVSFYRELALAEGMGDRIRFVTEFIPDADIPAYFEGCDAVALTYTGEFVSQSGVLQLAVDRARPVLASSGPGPLRDAVEQHGLGVFVEPDDGAALVEGLKRLMAERPDRAVFERYRNAASWGANVDCLLALCERIRGTRSLAS